MATTLPGSPYVESSDLVAGYPGVSESLAERVDTVGVLPFADSTARGTALPAPTDGQYSYLQDTNSTEYWDGAAWVALGASGLTLITAESFSAVSSVSVNNCFTNGYENYFLSLVFSATIAGTTSLRLRASGSDNTTSNYFSQRLVANGATLSGGAVTSQTSWQQVAYAGADGNNFCQFFVSRPESANNTTFLGDGISTSATITNLKSAGFFNASTQFDGITYFPASGTITGTLRVYGYKD